MDHQTGLFHKPKRRIAGKLLLGLTLVIIAFFLLFDINWLRPQLNETISDPSGRKVNIGQIDFSWLNPSVITLSDIKAQDTGVEATVQRVTVKLDLWRLFSKEVIVEHLSIESPKLTLAIDKLKSTAGSGSTASTTPNNEPATPTSEPPVKPPIKLNLDTITIDDILISDLDIHDASSTPSFDITGANIRVMNLELVKSAMFNSAPHLPGAKLQLFLTNLQWQQEQIGSVKLLAQTEADKVFIEQLKIEQAPSLIDLTAKIYTPFESPKVEVIAKENTVLFEQFSHLMSDLSIKPSGQMNFSTKITTQIEADDPDAVLNNLVGTFDANLQPGKLQGIDVNSALSALKDSQQTSLLDIGGYLLTGPLGLIAGQLFDLGSGVQALDGETEIKHLSLITKIDKGKVDLTDTALATNEYRLALKGKADIIKQEFDKFEFAILNDQGCADVSQSLNGPMSNPTSAVADSLLKSIASPVTDLVSEVKNTVSNCDVFYSGVVQQP